MVEPKVVIREVPAHWERPLKIDLTELAKLRLVKRWKIKEVMAHFGASYTTVMRGLRSLDMQKRKEVQNERI